MKKALCILALLACGITAYAIGRPAPDMMEYRVTAQPGDTVWSICARIATDRDDLSEVVYWSMRLSGIKDAGELQPGQEVRVKVRAIE